MTEARLIRPGLGWFVLPFAAGAFSRNRFPTDAGFAGGLQGPAAGALRRISKVDCAVRAGRISMADFFVQFENNMRDQIGRLCGAPMDSTKVTKAGDVFADLGFPTAEATSLRIRSELMTALRKLIEKRGWTQAEAAERLKVSQPRVSDLTRGKISRFSLDALVNMLTDVGMDVDVKVRRSSRRVA